MSRGEVWQACWGHRRRGWLAGNRLVDGGLPDLQGAPRAYTNPPAPTPCTIAPQKRRVRACCTDAICSWPAGSLCGMFICTCGG